MRLRAPRRFQAIAPETPLWVYAASVVPAGLLVVILVAQPWVPFYQLARDPIPLASSAGETKFYYGFLSNAGILVWCFSFTISLFTACLLRVQRVDLQARFFASAAAITLLLMIDDLFMIHEEMFPVFLGIHEFYMYVLYGALLGAHVMRFLPTIFGSDYVILALSFALFGSSVLVDVAMPEGGAVEAVLEDGSKFVGISAWAAFHTRAAWMALTSGELMRVGAPTRVPPCAHGDRGPPAGQRVRVREAAHRASVSPQRQQQTLRGARDHP